MSGLDGLQLDPDGFLDMDQFPDDGTELAAADLAELRETLHSDPVEEPTSEQWDAMFDEVVAADPAGPFAVDDLDAPVADIDGDLFALDGAAGEGLAPDDLAPDGAGDPDLDLDGADLEGPDVDDGLDLAPDDGLDDGFPADALDDAATSHDVEDLL